ncbi:sigma-70 family RNA polymerase sigma factor [Luteolibacter yonseiensis]|uniref:Sigma-70 family RNA polymerase sigma factor n=1 Tax=Luteolibacter yonseiensis TaxID=1144680 RepID=A0A934R2X8_9BACT|nr:sigma-70 family RNA polymerase sigma factor [Luteolibacter yonseiensis]MBK1814330.1 sigma-70 family RNA polymerase sigma factor [Luteolibacter yonseiensis]
MQNTSPTDAELLAEWVRHQREAAFHQLVTRYAGLVHAAARRIGNDDALADEATQLVFILLARKAGSLVSRGSLAGWLHLTAVMQTKNLLRASRRENRKRTSLQAAMQNQPHHPHDSWKEMQPELDEALAALSEKDREALLLRFYRSLAVREVALILGIATDSAQKRIDRATGRLREKLAKRGCVAGGSLTAAMLTGFTSDAKAAGLPISALTSKAIAAGSSTSLTLPILLTTVMKATTFAPPVIALILGGAWIVTQRQTIQALDRHSDLLETTVSTRTSALIADASPAKLQRSNTYKNSRLSIDWSVVAEQFAKANPPGQLNKVDQFMLEKRLGEMTQEDLLAGIDDISSLDTTREMKESMEEALLRVLGGKFPEFAVVSLIRRYQDATGPVPLCLAEAFGKWAHYDFAKASAWMDEQIAAGTFDYKSLSGENWLQNKLQQVVVKSLLSQPGDAATLRVMQVPEESRENFLLEVALDPLKQDETASFAKLVRNSLPVTGQQKVFSWAACKLAEDLPAVAPFLENIGATSEERAFCVANVAVSKIGNISLQRKIGGTDIAAIRKWIGEQLPEAVDQVTARVLDNAVRMRAKTTFSEAAAFAVEFSHSSGNDELLGEFLKSSAAQSNKDHARTLAEKISDEALRKEILKSLD